MAENQGVQDIHEKSFNLLAICFIKKNALHEYKDVIFTNA